MGDGAVKKLLALVVILTLSSSIAYADQSITMVTPT